MGAVGAFLQAPRRRARLERLRSQIAADANKGRQSLAEKWVEVAGGLRRLVGAADQAKLEALLAPFTCRLNDVLGGSSPATEQSKYHIGTPCTKSVFHSNSIYYYDRCGRFDCR